MEFNEKEREYFGNEVLLREQFKECYKLVPFIYTEIIKNSPSIRDELLDRLSRITFSFGERVDGAYGDSHLSFDKESGQVSGSITLSSRGYLDRNERQVSFKSKEALDALNQHELDEVGYKLDSFVAYETFVHEFLHVCAWYCETEKEQAGATLTYVHHGADRSLCSVFKDGQEIDFAANIVAKFKEEGIVENFAQEIMENAGLADELNQKGVVIPKTYGSFPILAGMVNVSTRGEWRNQFFTGQKGEKIDENISKMYDNHFYEILHAMLGDSRESEYIDFKNVDCEQVAKSYVDFVKFCDEQFVKNIMNTDFLKSEINEYYKLRKEALDTKHFKDTISYLTPEKLEPYLNYSFFTEPFEKLRDEYYAGLNEYGNAYYEIERERIKRENALREQERHASNENKKRENMTVGGAVKDTLKDVSKKVVSTLKYAGNEAIEKLEGFAESARDSLEGGRQNGEYADNFENRQSGSAQTVHNANTASERDKGSRGR